MFRSATTLGVLLLAAAATSAGAMPVVRHDVQVRFDLPNHGFEVVDVMTVPAGVDTLLLNAGVSLQSLTRRHPDGAVEEQRPGAAIGETATPDTAVVRLQVNPVGRPLAAGETMQVTLAYAARWRESTADVTFSRENVGREIQGTISDEGIYLAASSYWLPLADKALHVYRLKVVTPAGWEPLTQGERTLHQEQDGQLTTVWESDEPSDSLTLIANRYQVTERDFGGVLGATYFLADEPALVETYLERTGAYLDMYREMIGPYPFNRFTTVENWFPTGYGMPGWTLLGGQVLRLPFIPTTSFGHEIAHNWWGNSVFVDAAGGNWCEGLTVYCADYHYKELESPAAAREYRRTLLKDYAAYVRDGRDLPLRDFRERHSGATRAVGYGKSMMVFHMIDEAIGRDAFLAALREVARTHLFREAAWDDFLRPSPRTAPAT
ncbi:MAG: M1 family aminopeptidase [bacterium]|nr:M1 family aminopeptidase [bacterium]